MTELNTANREGAALETAPILYVEGRGIRFAWRRLGPSTGTPLVRGQILVGTAPRGGEEHLPAVLQEAFSHTEAPDPRLPLFFTPSSAGLAFLKRARSEPKIGTPTTAAT
jgi:hypothetical protein